MKKNILILSSLLLLFSVGCADNSEQVTSLENEVQTLNATIDTLTTENESLKNELDVLNTQVEEEQKIEEEKQAAAANADEAMSTQPFTVISTSVIVQSPDYKALYPDLASATIQNNSDDTIKNYRIAMVGFDSNGFPVKMLGDMDFTGGEYEKIISGEGVNITPGGTYGEDKGYSLDENHDITYVVACVVDADMYSGDTIKNDYYPYWKDTYVEKPQDVEHLKSLYN